jgi:hypothetical protein
MTNWRDAAAERHWERCRIIDFDDDGAEAPFELEEIERAPAPTPLPPPLFEPPVEWPLDLAPAHASRPPKLALFALMAEVPMNVWKRLAVYPLVGFFVFDVLFPCRGSLRLDALFALCAVVGTAGAIARFHSERVRWR